jgi:hypothetical protein
MAEVEEKQCHWYASASGFLREVEIIFEDVDLDVFATGGCNFKCDRDTNDGNHQAREDYEDGRLEDQMSWVEWVVEVRGQQMHGLPHQPYDLYCRAEHCNQESALFNTHGTR